MRLPSLFPREKQLCTLGPGGLCLGCSILGMYLFGGKFCMWADRSRPCTCAEVVSRHPLCRCDRKHFNDIVWALVTVFQVPLFPFLSLFLSLCLFLSRQLSPRLSLSLYFTLFLSLILNLCLSLFSSLSFLYSDSIHLISHKMSKCL